MKRFSVTVGSLRKEFVGGIDGFLAEDIVEHLKENGVMVDWDHTQREILTLDRKDTLEIQGDVCVSRLV